MKKILILVLLLLVTGCTVVRIDTSSIDNTINVVLSKNNKLFNRIGKGYKYYIPRDVSYIDTHEFNDRLYSDGIYYYLYIDAISYFHKKEFTYQEKDVYYSKAIDKNDKKGYLEITKQDGLYLVEFMYNYSKIEALVKKSDIEKVVLDASYILSTIKFNDNVIRLMLDEDYFSNKEEVYNIFESKTDTSDKFVKYDEDEIEGDN